MQIILTYTEFTANATLLFDLIFSIFNNMKTLVCDYHLNDPTIFLHHQISVCSAQARMLASQLELSASNAVKVDYLLPVTCSDFNYTALNSHGLDFIDLLHVTLSYHIDV